MVFVDNLASSLFTISFAGLLLIYTIGSVYLAWRKRKKEISDYLKGASIPICVIGIFILVSGLWGQFVWALPGSYNILFYDPFVAFGILLISFALVVRLGGRLDYIGFLALLMGAVTIVYGVAGYNLKMTSAPIVLLVMYAFYGLAGIFAYPISFMVQKITEQQKSFGMLWYLALALFFITLFLASAAAGFVGLEAIPAHLATPP